VNTTDPPPQARPRLPAWLRFQLPVNQGFSRTRALLEELKLHTVCQSAKCPNHWECWSRSTATFMIAGDHCTRACGFCAVSTAKPLPLETDEPARVAEATRRLQLKHVVVTAVARDDLPDGGAGHFRQTIEKSASSTPRPSSKSWSPIFWTRMPPLIPSSPPARTFTITTWKPSAVSPPPSATAPLMIVPSASWAKSRPGAETPS